MLKKIALIALLTTINLSATHPQMLPLRQKIAQMMVVATMADPAESPTFVANSPYNFDPNYARQMVEEEQVGGFIFLGPNRLEKMVALRNELQEKSEHPLLFFLDSEWGLSMRVPQGVVVYPRAMTLGALSADNDDMIEELGFEIGCQLKSIGIHSPLAPVGDVNNNKDNPVINTRSFGEVPADVARKATLFAQGLERAGVLSCGKHFPGHGDVGKQGDTHHNLVSVPHGMERLKSVEFVPFKAIIDNGVSAIMTAHLDVTAITQEPGIPATFSKKVIDLLRNELNFKGLILPDGLGMGGAQIYDRTTVVINAIKAGADIALCPVDVTAAIDGIEKAVNSGEIKEQEIDEHVQRIFAAKKRVCKQREIALDPLKLVNNQATDLKQKLYRSAITLARNNNRLPIKKNGQKIQLLTIGQNLDNAFATELEKHIPLSQVALSTKATAQECDDLLQALQDQPTILVALHIASRSGMIEMNKENNDTQIPPYASLINKLGKKTALVLFGNPYNLAHLSHSDATIVAYEDEPEAQIAAAQTVIGLHNPTGQLPVTASEDYPVGKSLSYN